MAAIAERIIARANGIDPDMQPGPNAVEAAYLEAFHTGAISKLQLDFYRLQFRGDFVVARLVDHATTGEKITTILAYANSDDYFEEARRTATVNISSKRST